MAKRNANGRDVAGYEEAKQLGFVAGLYWFVRLGEDLEPIGLLHTCPCGCAQLGSLYFAGRRPKEWGPGAEWKVARAWPAATLDPSIGFKSGSDSPRGADGYHWHGYFRAGAFEEC